MSDSNRRRARYVWTSVVCATIAAGLLWFRAEADYSNIYPDDYVGPDACIECHEDNHSDNYDDWTNHSHRVMNQNANEETVIADFSGEKVEYGRGYALFHRDGKNFVMSIYADGKLVRRHRVTRTVGSLYVQYYIGTQIKGPEPAQHISYRTENKLPFGYSVKLGRMLPEGYLDRKPVAEQNYLDDRKLDYIYGVAPQHNWNISCLYCHNTYPYVARLWKQRPPLHEQTKWLGGFPESSVNWSGTVAHEGRLELPYNARGLVGDELVTLGISCESCHFGGREHAREDRKIRFVPTAAELTIEHPVHGRAAESDRDDPFIINSICTQCHTAQGDNYADGASATHSNEGNALAAGACASAIKCTDCHNPHQAGAPSGSPDAPEYTEACLGCHPHLESATARTQHTRHSDKVSCLDCHMPRIVSGLDTVARSHRISSPTGQRMIRSGGPNACNLCHLDRPIGWTLDQFETVWGYPSPTADQLRSWLGEDVDMPVGEVWLKSSSPFMRSTAVEAYARAPAIEGRIASMLEGLNDSHAFNRTLALIALERVTGRKIAREDYDLMAQGEARAEQVARLAETLRDVP